MRKTIRTFMIFAATVLTAFSTFAGCAKQEASEETLSAQLSSAVSQSADALQSQTPDSAAQTELTLEAIITANSLTSLLAQHSNICVHQIAQPDNVSVTSIIKTGMYSWYSDSAQYVRTPQLEYASYGGQFSRYMDLSGAGSDDLTARSYLSTAFDSRKITDSYTENGQLCVITALDAADSQTRVNDVTGWTQLVGGEYVQSELRLDPDTLVIISAHEYIIGEGGRKTELDEITGIEYDVAEPEYISQLLLNAESPDPAAQDTCKFTVILDFGTENETTHVIDAKSGENVSVILPANYSDIYMDAEDKIYYRYEALSGDLTVYSHLIEE